MKSLIDKNARKKTIMSMIASQDKDLFQEVLIHAQFANEYVTRFHGRIDILNKVS